MSGCDFCEAVGGMFNSGSRGGMLGCGSTNRPEEPETRDTGYKQDSVNESNVPEAVQVHIDAEPAPVKIFCSLPNQSTVHFPIYPVCIKVPEEYSSSRYVYPDYPVEIRVNGKVIEDLTQCLNTFWGDAHLEEGKNMVLASLFLVGEVKTQAIELNYSPGLFTREQALLYGISGGKVLVFDVEGKKVLGKIKPLSNDPQLKSMALSPDYRRLYLPREDGIEVVDTKTSTVADIFDVLTGGEMALAPGGEGMFVNVPYYYDFPMINYVDAESGEVEFNLKGGCPACAMLNPPSNPSKLYVGSSPINVYQGPSFGLFHSIKAEGSDGMVAAPGGERLVTNGDENIYLIETKSDEILFYYKDLTGVKDVVFSPDGKVVYLGGQSAVEARDSKTMATLWQANGRGKLSISSDGSTLFSIGEGKCDTTLWIIDASSGDNLEYIDYVPVTGDMVYKPAY